jgi:hypothetical protein
VVLVSAPRDCQVVGPGLRACVEGCLAACVRWVGAFVGVPAVCCLVAFRAALDVGGGWAWAPD